MNAAARATDRRPNVLLGGMRHFEARNVEMRLPRLVLFSRDGNSGILPVDRTPPMKLKFSFSNSKDRTVSDDSESIQKQLADAQKEVQNAMREFRSWGTPYYEQAWLDAVEKLKRLEAKIPKKRAHSA